MAHDFNNLLTVINGYNEMVLNSCELPDKARQLLHVVRGAGERAATLARALMALSRRTPFEPRPVDLNESVRELVTLTEHLSPPNVTLSAVLEPRLHPVMADRCGILQVLLNLVVNSRDAMPRGGEVEIRTANLQPDADVSGSHPFLPPGNYVLLTVTDNGAGMDNATRQRIFEPFYTTKAPGAGNGLGLPMVQHIVKQSGGFLSIESAPGKGTTVRIYLPAAQGERIVEAPAAVESASTPRGGAETILVVEDNLDLRNLMRDVLQGSGYTVLAAGSGAEAVEVSQGLQGRLDLLVADAELPDSGSMELAECLREFRPELPVLHLSDCFVEDDRAVASPSGHEFLAKPFTLAALGRQVRSILDRQRRKRVLFVDDDPQVVTFASEVLRDAGYDVLVGEDGNVALATVAVKSVDLIITDLVMRECEGLETMMRLKKSHPGLPVVAISGAFGGHFLRSAAMLGARATLAKPFSGQDLLGVVGKILAS
jgi:DNA-binding response OmpR family regulator/two-component sensor histidine kinase